MSSPQSSVDSNISTPEITSEQLASQILLACSEELNDFLKRLKTSINDKVPKAEDFLPKKDKKIKTPRPANSNIIYTNLLNRLGFLVIIKGFFEINKINKQLLIPTSKKLSKFLWEELTDGQKIFFKDLAEEVKKLHKELYPGYKYHPRRNNNLKNSTKYIHYDPKVVIGDCEDQVPNNPAHQNDNEQQPENGNEQPEHDDELYWEGDEQIEDILNLNDDSQGFGNGPLTGDNDDSVNSQPLPTFDEKPLPPSLTLRTDFISYYDSCEDEKKQQQFPFYPNSDDPNNMNEINSNYSYEYNSYE